MPLLKFTAVEMTKAKVQRISLVEKAASRIPFKVVKQEKPMPALDLASVFKREKPVVLPSVAGVIVLKTEAFASIAEQIADAGFDIADVVEHDDGSVVFKQGDADIESNEDMVLVRLSDDAVLAVKGFRPYSMGMDVGEGTTFEDACVAQGFYPGVGTMVDVLRNSVLSLAEKSENPSEAADKIAGMFDEAKKYVTSMVKALPAKAFKLEFIDSGDQPSVSKSDATCNSCGADVEEADTVCKACGADPKKPKKAPDAAKKEDGEGNPSDGGAGADQNVQDPVAKSDISPDLIAKMLETTFKGFSDKLQAELAGVQKSVQDTTEAITGLSARVEKAEAAAEAATEAIKGTVVLGGGQSDPAPVVKKAESVGREIDTAFYPRRARR